MDWTMKVRTDEKLVVFIYSLLQRGVHVSQIEQAVDSATDILKQGNTVELCNGPLAVVAQEAARVIAGHGTIKVGKEEGLVCSKCGTVFMESKWPFKDGVKPRWVLDLEAGKCPSCGETWKK